MKSFIHHCPYVIPRFHLPSPPPILNFFYKQIPFCDALFIVYLFTVYIYWSLNKLLPCEPSLFQMLLFQSSVEVVAISYFQVTLAGPFLHAWIQSRFHVIDIQRKSRVFCTHALAGSSLWASCSWVHIGHWFLKKFSVVNIGLFPWWFIQFHLFFRIQTAVRYAAWTLVPKFLPCSRC